MNKLPTDYQPVIVVDTREPDPSPWEPYFQWPTIRQGLQSGDYSIGGCERLVAIERKSVDDLISCFCKSRERFERELHRLQAFERAWVIIEGSMQDLRSGNYRSRMNTLSAWESLSAMMVRYGVPFLCCGDIPTAAALCQSLFSKWFREHTKVVDAARKAACRHAESRPLDQKQAVSIF